MAEEKKLDIDTLIKKAKQHVNAKNIALLVTALTIIAIVGTIILKNATKDDFAVLYTGLSPDDAGQILTVLQEENIPYKVEGNGTIILVPKDKVYDIRLKLASKGIPSGKSVGFEIFEEPKMGTTQFQEQINYLRAVEGELERTIKQIDAIMDAKVNIALPKESIFIREEDEPKASVLIKLYPGKDLSKEQVKAIIFLVSNAVPKLKPENVSVIDNRGRVLSDLIENEDTQIASDKNLQIKKKLEKQIEKSVYSLLAKALGANKVVVKATVDLETGRQLQQDEIYDPDRTAVVSERKIQEKEISYRENQAGVPGTTTNVPPVLDLTGNANIRTQKERKDQTKNYDVTKSTIKTEKQIFKIKRISVGVLIDGKYIEEKDEKGNPIKKFVPRSQEEIKLYEELVKSAIGFNPERGDQVKVASIPFEAPPPIKFEEKKLTTKDIALLGTVGFLILTIIVLLLIFLVKSKKKKEQQSEQISVSAGAEGLASIAALHKSEEAFELENEPIYRKILEIAEKNPELIADLISKWLKEEGK
ncbi:MAG: flagellar M-ring protein FliF [Aquificae bacterium]|nr:flagellar M-ring protein FliF [Aquificota bacterium]